jgi:hypothetical protein
VRIPVGPGLSSATMGIVADSVLELRQAFDDAELRGDAEKLDALLADDFLSIGEQGYRSASANGSTGTATSGTYPSRPPNWTYAPMARPRSCGAHSAAAHPGRARTWRWPSG